MSNRSALRLETRTATIRAVEDPDRILVVDEDADFSDSVVRTLRLRGFDAEKRLDLPRFGAGFSAPPDVLLMELRASGLKTLDQLEAIRQRVGWADVPIICIAHPDDVTLRVRALELGANDFLTKPVALDELVARIRVQLRIARRVAALVGQAQIDPLTGILNRRGLLAQLQKTLAQARRASEPVAVLMLDLDGFKPINDELGHAVGDEVLAAVAQALAGCARVEDSIGRLGGDEFVVILPRADAAGAEVVMQRIRSALAAIRIPGNLTVRGSMGAVICSATPGQPMISAEDALRLADARMYEEKRSRRQQCRSTLRIVRAPGLEAAK